MYKARLTAEVVQWAYEKHLDGYTRAEIARAIGCSASTIKYNFDRAGLTCERLPLRLPKGMRIREEEVQ